MNDKNFSQGQVLKALKEKKRVTNEYLAKVISKTETTIYNYYNAVEIPYTSIKLICDALGEPIEPFYPDALPDDVMNQLADPLPVYATRDKTSQEFVNMFMQNKELREENERLKRMLKDALGGKTE
jgi:transcriptional regulator with XRE-family HTH domain